MLLVHRLVLRGGDGHLVALGLGPAHRHGVLADLLLVHGAAHRLAHHLVLVLDDRAGDRVTVLTHLRFGHGTEDCVFFLLHHRVVNGFVGGYRNFFRDHALAYPVADGGTLLHRDHGRRVLAGTTMGCPRRIAQPQTSQRQDAQEPKGSQIHHKLPARSFPTPAKQQSLAFLCILTE